jgi:hypothetical protein
MNDTELQTLLDLHDLQMAIGEGYWVKFEAWLAPPNEHIPYGIRYSFTLHNKYGTRLLGFDNAHAPKVKRRKFAGKRLDWDHKHYRGVVSDYYFDSAGQLVEDFWTSVNQILCEEGI